VAPVAPTQVAVAPAPVVAPPAPAPVVQAPPAPAPVVQALPPPPAPPAIVQAPPAPAAPTLAATASRPVPAPAAPQPTPPATKVTEQHEAQSDPTPLGDWQTEGNKGQVRIVPCGGSLCGYIITTTDARGESILVNMKSKSETQWTGNIISRASGNAYYAIMTLKDDGVLRVEACAVGHFFCSGNDWTRIAKDAPALVTSRQIVPASRS
jgi:hypothetical protein